MVNLASKILKMQFVAVMLCAWWACSAWAETYRWTDDAGVIHFSDSFDKIPSRYQQKATVDNDMSRVTIVPAAKVPEGAAAAPAAGAKAWAPESGRETDTKSPKEENKKTHAKHGKKGHKKPKGAVIAPPTTPARDAQNAAEERIRQDQQKIDDAQLPARKAQERADQQVQKAREKTMGH